jgi:hypothetical protein
MPAVLWTQRHDFGPSGRVGAAMAFDAARRRVLLFGGDPMGAAALAGDTWEWDGADWTQLADTGPSPRAGHQVAFDSHRYRLVLFGGEAGGGGLQGDTWEWDGEAWTQVADTGPDPRAGHQLAFDATRSRVVLFGGEAADYVLCADTWEWDGLAWTQEEDVGPPARRDHAMTFASRRDVVVLFGGSVGGSVVGDTWEWDGSRWRQAADFGPKPCRGAAMTSAAGATVLFGGLDPTGQPPRLSRLTWQWDGQHWVARQDMGPAGRWGHAIAFDEERGRIVLFGGLSVAPDAVDAEHGVLGDTWETSPPPPPANMTTFDLLNDTIHPGGTASVRVGIDEPAPAGGAVAGILVEGSPGPLLTLTVAPGSVTVEGAVPIPEDFPLGDVQLEARLGGQALQATLHLVPRLIAFTVPLGAQDSSTDVTVTVTLDRPAPAAGTRVAIVVRGQVFEVVVPAGSTVGEFTFVPADYGMSGFVGCDASLGDTDLRAVLQLV